VDWAVAAGCPLKRLGERTLHSATQKRRERKVGHVASSHDVPPLQPSSAFPASFSFLNSERVLAVHPRAEFFTPPSFVLPHAFSTKPTGAELEYNASWEGGAFPVRTNSRQAVQQRP
jgi:hypothetical protein